MIAQLASAATYGFGASLGRDIYRAVKKNPLVLGIIGAFLLCFGWRNVFLGVGRSVAYNIFVTVIGSGLMILAGSVITFLAGLYLGMFFQGEGQTGQTAVVLGFSGFALFSLVGIVWGMRDRKARVTAMLIERNNLAFLERAGLRDCGFESDSLQDADGNVLKLIEQTADRIVFSVAGRRGLRAAIKLEKGEMVSYSGVVKLTS